MTQALDKLVGQVASSIVNLARLHVTPYEGRVAEFNVAAWLHLPGLADLPVSLLISYRDGSARREVMVDHGKANQQGKILLSGVARLPVKQNIEDMQVRMRSAVATNSLIVEELFVQAAELPQIDSRQALA
ncbi:MAG: hypothetical protein VCA57_12830 [Pseudomonas sp.]|uniref:hypothetical protein n=1 Tax=Pseudomonas sp. TaxID=306 RepID=UPI003981A0EF